MQTFPLEQLDLAGAKALQFRIVEAIARHFDGEAILAGGDYGLVAGLDRPWATARAEAVLADLFGAEAACLARGAGTGAVRAILMAALRPGKRLLIHRAPVYPTTAVTIEAMGLDPVQVDLNDLPGLARLRAPAADAALVQHARQRLQDSYRLGEAIAALRAWQPGLLILTDDNYAALRVPKIGIQMDADASTFSLFKLLGPEGVGCVLGGQDLVGAIRRQHYSGGTQVQGPEALDALRALALAPVALAVQAEVVAEVAARLNAGEVSGVRCAHIANAQSRVVLAELEQPRARAVLEQCVPLGAAGRPVGAESRYEVAPLFYRVSGTFRQEDPALAERLIRINPMRAGADLVVAILSRALQAAGGG